MRLTKIKVDYSECRGCVYYPEYFNQHGGCANDHNCVCSEQSGSVCYIWINKPLVLNNIKVL